jgi:hypothetical protein
VLSFRSNGGVRPGVYGVAQTVAGAPTRWPAAPLTAAESPGKAPASRRLEIEHWPVGARTKRRFMILEPRRDADTLAERANSRNAASPVLGSR